MKLMRMQVGDRVRHTVRDEWGQGQVLEIGHEGRLTVYFTNSGKQLLKAGYVVEVTGAEAEAPFFMPRGGKRKAVATGRTIDDCKKAFLEQYPGGFADARYVEKERAAKVEAGELLADSLSLVEFRALIAEKNFVEICRVARDVVNRTNLIFRTEQISLSDGLKDAAAQEKFSRSLFALLHDTGPFDARFTAFVAVLSEIGAAKWPIATYFPFLMEPATHLFLKPTAAKAMAEICQLELSYQTAPNSLTYAGVQRLGTRLFEDLAELKPKDMMDVQSFMVVVTK